MTTCTRRRGWMLWMNLMSWNLLTSWMITETLKTKSSSQLSWWVQFYSSVRYNEVPGGHDNITMDRSIPFFQFNLKTFSEKNARTLRGIGSIWTSFAWNEEYFPPVDVITNSAISRLLWNLLSLRLHGDVHNVDHEFSALDFLPDKD